MGERRAFEEQESWQARYSDEEQRKKRDERNDEWRRDFEEIVQTVNSGIVSERRDDAVSHGPRKVVPDRYRGMSEDEIAAVRQQQLQQAEEEAEKKAQLQEEEKILQEAAVTAARQALLAERNLERQRREQVLRQQEENAILAEEQRAKRREEAHTVGRNQIDPAFFERFNTDAR